MPWSKLSPLMVRKPTEEITGNAVRLFCRQALAVRAVASAFDDVDRNIRQLIADRIKLAGFRARVSATMNEYRGRF